MTIIYAKVQIYVPDEQVNMLVLTRDAYQKACNWLSKYIFETKCLDKFYLNKLHYSSLRERFNLKSQMAQSVIKTVVASYKSNKSNKHKWSLVQFKRPLIDLVWKRDYSLTQNQFIVNTLGGRLKLNYERKGMKKYFNGTWKFGTAKLVSKDKKWFLHIPMTKAFPVLDTSEVTNIVGIDLGINFLATTYDSQGKTTFYSGGVIKHKRGQYKAIRKQLQMRQTPSACKRLKEIGSRESRFVTDVNHQTTKAIVNQYPRGTLFVLEDLTGVRSATKKVRVKNRYVSVSWAFYQFRLMLEYKAELNGQKVTVVDPKYTSQTCPKCGHIEKANRNKKLLIFKCKNCQYQSNDDRIGAMNLHQIGMKQIGVVTAGV